MIDLPAPALLVPNPKSLHGLPRRPELLPPSGVLAVLGSSGVGQAAELGSLGVQLSLEHQRAFRRPAHRLPTDRMVGQAQP